MEIKQELDTSFIKTEAHLDFYPEYPDFGFEEIEIGEEFKTEPLTTEKNYNLDSEHTATNNESHLAKHNYSKHSPMDSKLNRCNTCGKCHSCRSALQRHLKQCGQAEDSKKSLMQLSCDHCQYKTKRKSDLSRHIQAKHLLRDQSLNRCTNCNKSFSRRSRFYSHIKICGKSDDFKYSLRRYSCDHCSSKTNNKRHLSDHIQARHLPRDPNSNKCNKCGRCYSQISSLRRHLKQCGQAEDSKKSLKRYSCDHCQYKTFFESDLSRHIQAKHLPKDQKMNKCSKCKKSFSRPSCLNSHLKICSQSKDFKTKLMRYFCGHCRYKTDHKSTLSKHIQGKHLPRDLHSNKCKKCGKCYSWRSYLLKHSKMCGQTEDQKRKLMRYSCEHCAYKTDRESQLPDHILSKHLQ